MLEGTENFRALSDLLSAILAPMHETQDKQAQALVISAQQLQKLADMLQSEPTRQVMIDLMRGFLNSHNDEIKKYLDTVVETINQTIAQHNENCSSRHTIKIANNTARDATLLTSLTNLVTEAVEPGKKLVERWAWLRWEVRLYFTVACSLAGWIIWIYHHLPVLAVSPIPKP